MLSSSSTCSHFLVSSWPGLLRYAFVFVILFFPTWTLAQDSTRNFTIAIDSPQIIYTPFLCGRDNAPEDCNGGWVRRQADEPTPTILTTGPDPATHEIIPQMFFEFRGSALYLFTSPTSNAQANITITTNGTTIAATFDSRLGQASILNLDSSIITTFALTFLPDNTPREFSLTSINITIPNGTLTTTVPILPSMTLPPSSSPPIFTPFPTSTITLPTPPPAPDTQSVSSARRSNIALAVGVTIGLGLGLTSLAGIGFWWYRRRRPRRRWVRSLTTDQISPSRGGSRADSRTTGNTGRFGSGVVFGIGGGRSRSATPA